MIAYAMPLRDLQGNPRGGVHTLVDITEHKKMEKALQEAYEVLQVQSEDLQVQFEELQMQNEELQMQSEELNDAYETLHKSEKHYRMLFSNMTEAFFLAEVIYNKDGKPRDYRFLGVNPAYELNMGVKKEQMLGKSLFDVFPNAGPISIEKYKEIAISGQSAHFEVFSQALNNKYLDVYAFSPEKGKLAVIFRDITERKRVEAALQTSEEQYRTLFNTMNEGFCIIEMLFDEHEKPIDYIYIEANQAFDNQTVLKNVIGKRMRELAPGNEGFWFEIYGKVALTGESVRFENRAEALGRWYEVYAYKVGQPEDRKVAVIFNDITERKRAEEALEITLQRFYMILSNIHGAILLVSDEGYVEFANDTFCKWFNLSEKPADLIGITASEILRKIKEVYNDPDSAMALIKENVKRGKPVIGEEIKLIGGRTFIRDFIPLSVDGKLSGRLWYHIDITERKRIEEALQASRAKLEAALNSMTDAVFISDTQGNFIEFNNAFATFHKFKSKDECAKTLAEYPDFLDVFMADGTLAPLDMWAVPRALRGEIVTDAEYTLRRKDTGETWVGSYSFAPIRDKDDAIVGPVVIGRDISKRKQAEEALLESEQRLQSIIDGSDNAFYVKDLEGRFILINKHLEELLGMKRDEVYGKTDYDFFTREMAGSYRVNDSRILASGVPEQLEEVSDLVDGHHIFLANKFPLYDLHGKPYAICGISADITERKRIDEALKVSEEKYRNIIETANEGIWTLDADVRITYANNKIAEMLGYSPEEMIGKPGVYFVDNEYKKYTELRTETRKQGIDEVHENKLVRKDDSTLWTLVNSKSIFDKDGKFTGILAMLTDITARKQADEALHEAYQNLQVQSEELQAQSEELQMQSEELQEANEALRESEERFHTMANAISQLAWIAHPDGHIFGITSAGMLTPAPCRSRWKAGAGRVFTTLKFCQKYWGSGMLRLLRGRCLIWNSLCVVLMAFSVHFSLVFCL